MPDQLFNTDNVDRDASFSSCGRYRWSLSRNWGTLLNPWVGWVMLNPSTADASIDDPTIRRCMGFARAWGYGGIHVCNLFAFRATDPGELMHADMPVAPAGQIEQYDDLLLDFGRDGTCDIVIAAWGVHGCYLDRDRHVAQLYQQAGVQLYCLGTTNGGHPKHPLARGKHRVPDDFKPIPFQLPEVRHA